MIFRRFALPVALLTLGIGIGAALAQAQQPSAATDVSVIGMENTTRQLQAMKDNRNANQALVVLSILQVLGKKQPAQNGLSRLDYRVEVSPDGRVVINGLDVSAITALANQKKG